MESWARQIRRGRGPLPVLLCALLPWAAAQGMQDTNGGDPAAAGTTTAPVARSETGLLDVHVRETDLATVLEMLSYEARTNIVASTSVRGAVSANLYGVTLENALDALLRPNKFAYQRVGNTYFVGTQEEMAAHLPPPVVRIYRLKYISRIEAVGAVRALLGEAGEVTASAAGTGDTAAQNEHDATDLSTDYLIVRGRPDVHAAVDELLRIIDVRPKQVLIEATILRATLNEGNELGIDFTLLGGVDFENVASVSNASSDVTTGLLPSEQLQNTTLNVNTGFTADVSPGGLAFGIISNNIGIFLRALEDITDVVVVANPKVIALNKQEAQVIVGRRDGYLTTTVTETAAVQTVEFLETGTQIKIRPVINDDGTVRLWVHPKDSNGGLTASNLPFEETTEAQASILVEDGHTVLIGGLFRERTLSSRRQIPGFGSIPGLGVLFQNTIDQTIREEVIVLLTVHVLKDTPAEQERFAEIRDDIERIRIGLRRGLFGLGRERLAQAYYQEAVRQAERGENCLAELNARMALHNQPKHAGAMRLLERVMHRRLWESDGSRIRTLVTELIDIDRSPAAPPEPPPYFGRPIQEFRLEEPVEIEETPQQTPPAPEPEPERDEPENE